MTQNHNAKYVFYYLLSLVALIFMTISVGMILFCIIDKLVIDVLNNSYNNYDAQLKFAISALIISTPIFYAASSLIQRGLVKGELDKESGVRRWLTYLITLISSIVILGVFVSVINNFLSGELTARFILKSLTMLILSGAVFSFYFYSIKREEVVKKDRVIKIFMVASLILVIAVFVASWFFVESPQKTRNRRLDQVVMNNIYNIESIVNNYYERHEVLPANLEELGGDKSMYLDEKSLINPLTNQAIEYHRLDENSFELCTEFKTSDRDFDSNEPSRPVMLNNKQHEAGWQCVPGALWSLDKVNIVR